VEVIAMPEIDDIALQRLQAAFEEVAFRANRLREWMEFDRLLRYLERRFIDFSDDVTQSIGNVGVTTMPKLNQMWNRCKELELVDLQSFAEGVKYINRTSWMNGTSSQTPTTVMRIIDVSSLNQYITPLEKALTDQALPALSEQCSLFRRTLKGQIASRQQSVSTEITELCELTIQLRMQVEKK
jgi:hypothetical protein